MLTGAVRLEVAAAIAGLLVAVPVVVIAGLGVWRRPPRSVLACGTATGAGLLVGTQVSPRGGPPPRRTRAAHRPGHRAHRVHPPLQPPHPLRQATVTRVLVLVFLASVACTSTVDSTPRPADPALSARLLTEPDRFDPDRRLPGTTIDTARRDHGHLPFGTGPPGVRRCRARVDPTRPDHRPPDASPPPDHSVPDAVPPEHRWRTHPGRAHPHHQATPMTDTLPTITTHGQRGAHALREPLLDVYAQGHAPHLTNPCAP
ncbi:hypothetical protein B0I31_12833 [Saccharothrix carnea]|uniref:Uncharacterized protein n=1 Tax=Saccharothrix carnea TaxID=1280637 RepID=A0A2P8HEG6_SACCR|nr:hypothetical protein B0I31_12833 [Saccharothrix carnea]